MDIIILMKEINISTSFAWYTFHSQYVYININKNRANTTYIWSSLELTTDSSKFVVVWCWMCWHDDASIFVIHFMYEYILSLVAKWSGNNVCYEMESFYQFHLKYKTGNGRSGIYFQFSTLFRPFILGMCLVFTGIRYSIYSVHCTMCTVVECYIFLRNGYV